MLAVVVIILGLGRALWAEEPIVPSGAAGVGAAVTETVEAARKQAKTLQMPENRHRGQGYEAAQQVYERYQSPPFQQKLQQEQQKIVQGEILAKGTEEKQAAPEAIPGSLFLFLSSSVPQETLQAYMRDLSLVESLPVRAVLPGLPMGLDNLRENQGFFSRILQIDPACRTVPDHNCPWLPVPLHIDPILFTRFGISAAPALLYELGGNHWLIQGDAGLATLVELLARASESPALQQLSLRLRGSH